MEKVNLGKLPVAQLRPGSNTDLGIMRALAVVQELKKFSNEGKIVNVVNTRAGFKPAPISKLELTAF
ncbi:hypothetical protein NIES932_05520 [Raphidiopsis curvata NIES-932]|nr:hypothetical protein NIES932_05520 [Raphidiopsis curvata NIES-932]